MFGKRVFFAIARPRSALCKLQPCFAEKNSGSIPVDISVRCCNGWLRLCAGARGALRHVRETILLLLYLLSEHAKVIGKAEKEIAL